MAEINLRIAIDGVTINQSLDLLTVDSATDVEKSHIKAAWKSYRMALENLVNAAILSDVLVFDAKIVRGSVTRDSAFSFMEELAAALSESGSGSSAVLFDTLPEPEKLFSSEEAMKHVAASLPAFERVVTDTNRHLWRDFITREFTNYAGSHPSLRKDLPPCEYLFCDGRRDFFVNEGTDALVRPHLNGIPRPAIDWFKQQCITTCPSAAITHPAAIEEFCRRVLYAHVLIGENAAQNLDLNSRDFDGVASVWRDSGLVQSVSDLSFCPTRQDIRRVLNHPVDDSWEHEEARFMTAVLPYLFERVLANLHASRLPATSPLADALAAVRTQREVKTLRDLLKRLRARGTTEAAKELARYTDELSASTYASGKVEVEITTPSWKGPGAKANTDLSVLLGESQQVIPGRRAHWALYRLRSQGSPAEVDQRITGSFMRLFPKTFA
jgi:hypothetical protein